VPSEAVDSAIRIRAMTFQYSCSGNFLASFAISRHVSNSVYVGSKSIMVREQVSLSVMLNFGHDFTSLSRASCSSAMQPCILSIIVICAMAAARQLARTSKAGTPPPEPAIK